MPVAWQRRPTKLENDRIESARADSRSRGPTLSRQLRERLGVRNCCFLELGVR